MTLITRFANHRLEQQLSRVKVPCPVDVRTQLLAGEMLWAKVMTPLLVIILGWLVLWIVLALMVGASGAIQISGFLMWLSVLVPMTLLVLWMRDARPRDPNTRVARLRRPTLLDHYHPLTVAGAVIAVLSPIIVAMIVLIGALLGAWSIKGSLTPVVLGLGGGIALLVIVVGLVTRVLHRGVSASDDEQLFWSDAHSFFMLEQVMSFVVAVPLFIQISIGQLYGRASAFTESLWLHRFVNFGWLLCCLGMVVGVFAAMGEPRFIQRLWGGRPPQTGIL